MNRKNVIRTLTAIAAVLVLGWLFFYFSDSTRGYKPVDTSVAVAQINSDNVKSAQIDDREQQVRLTLKNGNEATAGSVQPSRSRAARRSAPTRAAEGGDVPRNASS